jgi:hypothetical protein
VQHSREPRAMLTHGTQPHIISDGDMEHNPNCIPSRNNDNRNWNYANSSKEKQKWNCFQRILFWS